MKDNKNKKIIIGFIVGALMIISVGCANNVATSEQVNIDTVTSDVAEAAKGDTIEEKSENDSEVASDVASSVVSDVEASEEASTEASIEEKVEATTETSTVTTSAYGTPQEYML